MFGQIELNLGCDGHFQPAYFTILEVVIVVICCWRSCSWLFFSCLPFHSLINNCGVSVWPVFGLWRRNIIITAALSICFYLLSMSYTLGRPVTPCSPDPATLGRSFYHQHPPSEQWSLWRSDLCPYMTVSQTSWNQSLYRCWNMSTGNRSRDTE